ncbi:hypothetical protein EDC01DRAFT_639571 [Geopyxis carbonaria]|nr:hypothetical protein EDC01DRAFT_639571 [Geopyxis carbonaria]
MATLSPAAELSTTRPRNPVSSRKGTTATTTFHTHPQPKPDRSVEVYEKLIRSLRDGLSRFRLREPPATEAQESPYTGISLGDRFFSLPLEIQVQVINHMALYDILRLRMASRQFRQLIQENESYIVTRYIKAAIPPFMIALFPLPTDNGKLQISYLTDLARRQRVSTELATALAKDTIVQLGMCREHSSPTDKRIMVAYLRRSMSSLVFVLYHFFETYRRKKLEFQASGETWTPTTNLHLQLETMARYPDSMMVQIHQMYELLMHLFFRRMSMDGLYFGRIRVLEGIRPESKHFVGALVLGGLDKVWELYRIKGFKKRRKALKKWIRSLQLSTVQAPEDAAGTEPHELAEKKWGKRRDKGKGPKALKTSSPLANLLETTMDDLPDLWVPAAESRLLGRGIVSDLDEVSCIGRFISALLLATLPEDYGDNDEYADDSDDEEDEEEEESHGNSPANTTSTGTAEATNSLADEAANEYEESGNSDLTSSTA